MTLVSTNKENHAYIKEGKICFFLEKGKIWYFLKDQGKSPKQVQKRAEKLIDRDVHTPDNMYCD